MPANADCAYLKSLAKCRRVTRTEGMDAVMASENPGALVAPTLGPACLTDPANGNRWWDGSGLPRIRVVGWGDRHRVEGLRHRLLAS